MSHPNRNACMGIICMLLAAPAAAQSSRDIIAGARLAPGYAQILNLAATPDISAAKYRVTDDSSQLSINVLRLPYESRWLALSDNSDLYWRVAGGYLTTSSDFPTNSPTSGSGSISSTWSAYSLTGGLLAKIRFGEGFTLVPALDMGAALLDNQADYAGGAIALQPALDGLLFNWRSNAWLVTPNVGLEWTHANADRKYSVRGHVAWSWISSFAETDPVLKFNETAGVYSIRAERVAPTGKSIFDRSLGWVLFGGYAGFFGPNRNALGFTSVAEVGLGLEAPLSTSADKPERLRVGASYLFGPNVTGWTISAGMKF